MCVIWQGVEWTISRLPKMRESAFAVKRNISQAKGFTMAQLKRALYDGADLEESVKTGRMNDQMAVELFIMKYSRSEK